MALKEIFKKYKPLDNGLAEERMDMFQSGLDVIATEHLSKSFQGIKAVNDLSIAFPKGTITGLIGPNGSGKSTLINLLTGLLTPDAGSIVVNERAYPYIKPHKLRKFKIARTFQDGRLVEQMSVEDNLLLAVAQNGICQALKEIKTTPYKEKLERVLVKIGLKDHHLKRAEELSYGQRKLLEIGRALMQDADVYIFDEPFTGLSPQMVEEVLSIIEVLRVESKTVILIEHNMGLIERLSDYVIVLDHGMLLASGAPKDILKNKQVQEAYLGV